ncbi:MAG: hypothetical protein JNL54_01395 [Kineosporiaceae bacterium]|nr:hypothetical protein [Kineosporiaceae bacterium]
MSVEGTGGPQDAIARAAAVENVRRLLRVPPPFAVMGLSHPALTPSRLVQVNEVDGVVTRISLGFGDALGSAGRFALVISGQPGRPLDDLADLLAAEAVRLGEEVTQDPPTAPELTPAGGLRLNIPLEVDGLIVVEGLPVPAHLRRQGRLWAAHITASPGRVVTVIARGVDPGTLQLSEVRELRPYVNAWEEHQLKAMAAAAFMSHHPVAPEAPAQGLDAHIGLLRAWVADRNRPTGANDPLWEAAVRTQVHYGKQTEPDAADAVNAMVNQALRLAERAPWFTDGTQAARAIEELARYTVFDSDVPSRRAQEWWGRVWVLSTTRPPDDPDQARERMREHAATEAVWLTAWERWATGDDGHGRRR